MPRCLLHLHALPRRPATRVGQRSSGSDRVPVEKGPAGERAGAGVGAAAGAAACVGLLSAIRAALLRGGRRVWPRDVRVTIDGGAAAAAAAGRGAGTLARFAVLGWWWGKGKETTARPPLHGVRGS